MVDKRHIGRQFAPHTVEVEKGPLRFFAKAIGEADLIYTDEAAARKAGYRSLPVPPTYLLSLDMARPDAFAWMVELGIDLKRMLHGEQSFEYFLIACAGDVLTFEHQVADIYEKKGGALQFVQRKTKVTNQDAQHVANLNSLVVIRNG